MKICVVGGTGNISTSIVRLLLDEGHDVTCFSRGQSGSVPSGARHLRGDRMEREGFEKGMQDAAFDAAIDMMCFTPDDAESSIRAFRGVEHFIVCSTVASYGVEFDWLPVTEEHPLRPTTGYGRGKRDADAVFRAAHKAEEFPITIIKPSFTYGPKWPLLRQISPWKSLEWIDRVRKGKPIVVCGDGDAIIQFLHVDDAAPAFVHVIGRGECIGETYNMVDRGYTTWAEYHRTVMKVIGREVEIVGVPFADLQRANVPGFGWCVSTGRFHHYFSGEKLMAHVPEFRPSISLETGIEQVIEAMDRKGIVGDSDAVTWEDEIITAQRLVQTGLIGEA